jgi:hypothetical protein
MFEFDGVPTDIIWYSRLRQKIGGMRPKCGHSLPSVSTFVEKMRIDEKTAIPGSTK